MAEFFHCPYCSKDIEMPDTSSAPEICPFCETVFPNAVKKFIPGSAIGGYELKKILGVGGMGIVYLAIQKSVGREVALKVLPANLAMNEEHCQRFFREVRTLAMIEHPNIVQAIEGGVDKSKLYFSMTYVNGRDIRKMLSDGKKFSEAEALGIILKIAEALRYVWEKHKVIHRDIKPGNIMLSDDDNEVKLMDLGISKNLKIDTEYTAAGIMVGSPSYMSPEQARALKDVDFRADIYALGGTFYHMLTGALPYDAESSIDMITMHISDPIPDPRKIIPAISENSVAIINKAMAKKPADRYQDWAVMINAIDDALDSLGVEISDDGILISSPEPAREIRPQPVSPAPRRKMIMPWHRIVALLVLLVLFIMAFSAVIKKSILEERINKAKLTLAAAKNLIARKTPDDRANAIILLENVQKMNMPAFSQEAVQILQSIRKEFLDERKKEDTGKLEQALAILKKNSATLELSGHFEKALQMWQTYKKEGEYKDDPKIQREIELATEYLSEKVKLKKEGLLDE